MRKIIYTMLFLLCYTSSVFASTRLNVKDFGAVGDGVTDDTAAFNACQSYLSSGGVMIVPGGKYALKNFVINKSGVTLIGDGSGYIGKTPATELLALSTAGTSDEVVKIDSIVTYNTTIENLAINGNAKVNVTLANIGTKTKLKNVLLLGGLVYQYESKVDTTLIDSNDEGGIFDCIIYGKIRVAGATFNIERGYFNGNGGGKAIEVDAISATIGSTSISITDCQFDSYGTELIDVGQTQVVQSFVFEHNYISNVWGTGGHIIKLGSTNGVRLVSIQKNYFAGLQPTYTASRAIYVKNGQRVTIRNNDINGSYTGGNPIYIDDTGLGSGDFDISQNGCNVELSTGEVGKSIQVINTPQSGMKIIETDGLFEIKNVDINISSGKNYKINGTAIGTLSEGAFTDYSETSTITGWSTYGNNKYIKYKKVGKGVCVYFMINGTSNSSTTTFTLPYTSALGFQLQSLCKVQDDGVWSTGIMVLNDGSNVLTFYKSVVADSFTATGTKAIMGELFYETSN